MNPPSKALLVMHLVLVGSAATATEPDSGVPHYLRRLSEIAAPCGNTPEKPQNKPVLKVTAVHACAGDTVNVDIKGKFPADTAFVPWSDQVQVVSEKIEANHYRAAIKLSPDLPPVAIAIAALSPTRCTPAQAPVIQVGCSHQWVIGLDTGEELTVTTRLPRGAAGFPEAQGTWKKGGKVLGETNLRVIASVTGFTFERPLGADDQQARQERAQAALESPEQKELDRREDVLHARLNPCIAANKDKSKTPRPECTTLLGDLEKLEQDRAALMRKIEGGAPAGCGVIDVDTTLFPRLSATASACSDLKEHQVTVKVVASK